MLYKHFVKSNIVISNIKYHWALLCSMPERMADVRQVDGGYTDYGKTVYQIECSWYAWIFLYNKGFI